MDINNTLGSRSESRSRMTAISTKDLTGYDSVKLTCRMENKIDTD